MANQYTLDQKMNALDLLESHDCDYQQISEKIHIPISILQKWKYKESDLRREYRGRLLKQFARLKLDLQVKMLQRGMSIVDMLDEETLRAAPLNQLATTLSALVNHALKLEEAITEDNEQAEKIVRFEYLYNGSVHNTPPWAGASEGLPRKVQGSSLRETLGQDGIGQDDTHRTASGERQDTWLVARSDLSDGESTLEGMEDEHNERNERLWYHD